MPRGRAGFTLNPDAIMARIMRGALRGARAGADITEGRAKARAPVRKLFKGTTYRVRTIGTQKIGSRTLPGERFREPINRQVRSYDLTGATQKRDPVTGMVREGRAAGDELDEFRGHPNSPTPLFRRRTGGESFFITGDFRRVNPLSGKLATLRPKEIEMYRTKGGKTTRVPVTRGISGEELRDARGGGLMTSAGRWEARSGRANFHTEDTGDEAGGQTRVGGRLRGEIHVEGPTSAAGKSIWYYVVSATKDPQTGRLYPRDQEFGTRHHPPHPFLRPALLETRRSFAYLVARGVKEEFRSR